MQSGMPEWDPTTEYFTGQFAADGLGGYYISLTDNNLGNALTDVSNWVQTTGPQRVGDFLVTGTANSPTFQSATVSSSTVLSSSTAIDAKRANASTFYFSRRSSGTIATPTAVASGAVLKTENIQGHDGSGYEDAVFIRAVVDAAVSPGIVPGRLEIYTANTAGALVERLRIDSAGVAKFFGGVTVGGNTTADAGYGTITPVTGVQLSKFYQGSFPITFLGGTFASGGHVVTIDYTKVGNLVTLLIPQFTAPSAAVTTAVLTTAAAAIPVNLRPLLGAFNYNAPYIVIDSSGDDTVGVLRITTAGGVAFYRDPSYSTLWTSGGATIGWNCYSVSYVTA
jgi:hypothetical protein